MKVATWLEINAPVIGLLVASAAITWVSLTSGEFVVLAVIGVVGLRFSILLLSGALGEAPPLRRGVRLLVSQLGIVILLALAIAIGLLAA